MIDLDAWQEVGATLRKNPLRTALTGLGVLLGIVILMVMLGFGAALERGVTRTMAGFAANAVFVWGQRTSVPHQGLPANRSISFDNADVEALRRLPEIQHLAPRNQLGGFMGGFNVRYQGKTGSFSVAGDVPALQHVSLPVMKAGRFLDDLDLAERRKVCVIGTGVVDQLYPPGREPIGSYLEISGVYFQVVGVFGTRQAGQQGDRAINTIHVPFTTFQQAFNVGDRVGWFAITGRPGVDAAALERAIRALLGQRHRVAPEDELAIGAWNAGKEFAKMQDLFVIINVVLAFAGVMTLAAGVVGVSNIMLISVRERTREIGVRKALGARPTTIVAMVVREAVALTVAAGYLGLVAGVALLELGSWAIARAGDQVPLGPMEVGLGPAAGAAAILVVFGALAGLIPAYHAARIQPVEALRTD
jgi:putative ABC transport system permease protein